MEKYLIILIIIIVLYYIEKFCIQSEVDKILITKNIIEKFSQSTIINDLLIGGLKLTGSLIIDNKYKLTADNDSVLRLTDVSSGKLSNLYINDLDISGELIARQSISSSSQNVSFTNLSRGVLKLDYNNNMAGFKSLTGPLNINVQPTSKIQISGNMDISGDFKFYNVKPILIKKISIGTSNNINTEVPYSIYSGIAFSGYSGESNRKQATIIQFNTYKNLTTRTWFISFTPNRPNMYPSLGVKLTFFHKNFVSDQGELSDESIQTDATPSDESVPIVQSPKIVTTTTNTPVPEPISITVEQPIVGEVNLTWEASSAAPIGTNYTVINLPQNSSITNPTSTSATITGLVPGTYTFTVQASTSATGYTSSQKSSQSVTLNALAIPVVEVSTITPPTFNTVTLNITRPTNAPASLNINYNITGFEGGSFRLNTDKTIATITGLTSSRTYNFTVQASYNTFTSQSSTISTATVATVSSGSGVAPSVPLNVRADISGNTATIKWNQPNTNAGITGYTLNLTSTTLTGAVTATTYEITDPNTLQSSFSILRNSDNVYAVSVTAESNAGNSDPSTPIKLPILYIPQGQYNDGLFIISKLRYFNQNNGRLLVDTNRPSGNGLFTLYIQYSNSETMITDSNVLPNTGNNILGGYQLPWTDIDMGMFEGKLNGTMPIKGSVEVQRDVLIKLIDNGNTITSLVTVYPEPPTYGFGGGP
jgi:hypothetical protein